VFACVCVSVRVFTV